MQDCESCRRRHLKLCDPSHPELPLRKFASRSLWHASFCSDWGVLSCQKCDLRAVNLRKCSGLECGGASPEGANPHLLSRANLVCLKVTLSGRESESG